MYLFVLADTHMVVIVYFFVIIMDRLTLVDFPYIRTRSLSSYEVLYIAWNITMVYGAYRSITMHDVITV